MIRKFDVAYFMVSFDPIERNTEFAKMHDADFPILSDAEKTVGNAYGVVNPTGGRARRWTFYIGPDQKILHIDKMVSVNTAGEDLAKKLEELGVKKK